MRKVPTVKRREYANSLGALFAETSAAHDVGIRNMFTNTAMKIVNLHKVQPVSLNFSVLNAGQK